MELQENAVERLRLAHAVHQRFLGPLMGLVGILASQPWKEIMKWHHIPTEFPRAAHKASYGAIATAHSVEQVITGDLRTLKLLQAGTLGSEAVGDGQIATDGNPHDKYLRG